MRHLKSQSVLNNGNDAPTNNISELLNSRKFCNFELYLKIKT